MNGWSLQGSYAWTINSNNISVALITMTFHLSCLREALCALESSANLPLMPLFINSDPAVSRQRGHFLIG